MIASDARCSVQMELKRADRLVSGDVIVTHDPFGRLQMERVAWVEIGGGDDVEVISWDPDGEPHCAMVEGIRSRLGLTTLQYQRLDDLLEAIGLPRENVCTYCWDGTEE